MIQDWVGRFDVREKGPADLVTEADLASQEAVRRVILDEFPDHVVLGEEDQGPPPGGSGFRWIVDPLDGTTNYVHRVPHYAVSLGLEQDGRLLAGAVYDPNREECFTATAGGGAFLNGRPMRVSSTTRLGEALAAVGFPPRSGGRSRDLAVFLAVLDRCHAIRRTGSSALNLCYLAAGRFDVYWSFSTKIWDVAAGILIVQEAGGTVTSPDGGAFVLEDVDFLAAATGPLHRELCELVAATPSVGPATNRG